MVEAKRGEEDIGAPLNSVVASLSCCLQRMLSHWCTGQSGM